MTDPVQPWPVSREGDQGRPILTLQEPLRAHGNAIAVDVHRIEGSRSMAEPLLKRGASGTAVRQLQAALKEAGHDPGPIDGVAVRRVQKRLTLAGFDAGDVDGIFGARTEAGVKALQRGTGLVEDGIVGPQTWDAIDALGD